MYQNNFCINIKIWTTKTNIHRRSVLWCLPSSLSMSFVTQSPRMPQTQFVTLLTFESCWNHISGVSGLYFHRNVWSQKSPLPGACLQCWQSDSEVQKVAGCPSFDCYFSNCCLENWKTKSFQLSPSGFGE